MGFGKKLGAESELEDGRKEDDENEQLSTDGHVESGLESLIRFNFQEESSILGERSESTSDVASNEGWDKEKEDHRCHHKQPRDACCDTTPEDGSREASPKGQDVEYEHHVDVVG